MTTPAAQPALADLDRRIRRAGKIGRILCTILLVGGALVSLWLMGTTAANPEAIVKMNLPPERTAQVEGFKKSPGELVMLLLSKPTEVESLAHFQAEANKFQDLVDHPQKRGVTVAFIALFSVLILGFIWLVRQLFAAFAEGRVIGADNARTLKRLGVIALVCGGLGFNLGLVIAGLLLLVLGWNLQQALALQAEQALVI